MKLSPAFQLLLSAVAKTKALKNVNIGLPHPLNFSSCGSSFKKKLPLRARKAATH